MANTPTPSSSTQQSLLGDSAIKTSSLSHTSSHDNRLNDSLHHHHHQLHHHSTTTIPPTQAQISQAHNNTTKICSNNNNSNVTGIGTTTNTATNEAQNIIKMLPTSPNSGNNALGTGDDMENTREDSASSAASGLTITSSIVDLATDNLPAVDTPDACDKAALR